MAAIVDEVKRCMISYPSLAPTVGDVLHHMFFVIGNGYHWENGELVCSHEMTPLSSIAQVKLQKFDEQIANYQATRLPTIDLERERLNYQFTVENLDRVVTPLTLRMSSYSVDSLYPLSVGYSQLFQVPDDVATDWLEVMSSFTSNLQVSFHQKAIATPLTKDQQAYQAAIAKAHAQFETLLEERRAAETPAMKSGPTSM